MTKFFISTAVFILIIFFVLTKAYGQIKTDSFSIYVRKADSCFRQGSYKKSQYFYKSALKIKPKDAYCSKRIKLSFDDCLYYYLREHADYFFYNKDYGHAQEFYYQCTEHRHGDKWATERALECETKTGEVDRSRIK